MTEPIEGVSGGKFRIDRLYLKGVGPFAELDLELGRKQKVGRADLHILVGPNGSGKSTLLYAIAGLFGFGLTEPKQLVARMHAQGSTVGGLIGTETVGLGSERAFPLKFTWYDPLLTHLVTQPPITWFVSQQTVHLRNLASQLRDFSESPKLAGPLAFAAFSYAGQRQISSYELGAIQEPSTSPLVNALSFTETANTSDLVQWLANSYTKELLADKDGNSAAASRYRSSREMIESAIREVTGEDIHFEMAYEPLGINIRRDAIAFELNLLPDGSKSILSWIADLIMRLDRISWIDSRPILEREFLLLLDEVDIHLHPAWQRKILPMVQKLFPNAQIFVSTHSPFVVSSVSDAWVYLFGVKDGVASLRERVESKAGTSVSSVLEALFGVREEFDVDTEAKLKQFYELRAAVLRGEKDLSELKSCAEALGRLGYELEDIVASELQQVAHRRGSRP